MGANGGIDDQVEQTLGNLLRAGVLLSALVTLVGGVAYLVRHGADPVNYRDFGDGTSAELRSPPGILRATAAGSGRGLVQFGLLLLIATPVARVAFSVVAFLRQRDWTYVALTLFVLAVLVFSLGHGGG